MQGILSKNAQDSPSDESPKGRFFSKRDRADSGLTEFTAAPDDESSPRIRGSSLDWTNEYGLGYDASSPGSVKTATVRSKNRKPTGTLPTFVEETEHDAQTPKDASPQVVHRSDKGGAADAFRTNSSLSQLSAPYSTTTDQASDEEEENLSPEEIARRAKVERRPIPTPGSKGHADGDCRPCAFFHKAIGCENGAECRHCHLCPEGELKSRKRNKLQCLRSAKSVDSAVLDVPLSPPPGLEEPSFPVSLVQPAISKGSEFHGNGACRPCAWYYKARGCENGAECRHCHLCPEGEIKARRKAKAFLSRAGTRRGEDGNSDEDEQQPQGEYGIQLPVPSRHSRPPHQGLLPSPGSELHGTGRCRPCAWFHRDKGCENGDQCRHCHLCPEGEIKERRKAKISSLKQQGGGKTVRLNDREAMYLAQRQHTEMMMSAAQAHMWQCQAAWQASLIHTAAAMRASSPMSLFRTGLDGSPTLAMERTSDEEEEEEEDTSAFSPKFLPLTSVSSFSGGFSPQNDAMSP